MINFFLLLIALRKCFVLFSSVRLYYSFLLIGFVFSSEFWNSVHSAFAPDWSVPSGRATIDVLWLFVHQQNTWSWTMSSPRKALVPPSRNQNVCLVANQASWKTKLLKINVSVTDSYQIFSHPCLNTYILRIQFLNMWHFKYFIYCTS